MAKRLTKSKMAPPPPVEKYASMYPGTSAALHPGLVGAIDELERELQLPVWLIIQDGSEDEDDPWQDSFNMIGNVTASAFFAARHGPLRKGQRVALMIDSGGGKAGPSYEIAMLLRRHCGGFTAVIPRHAKSAATLLALGADEIILNDHAELGPLDVQIFDPDREEVISGLDEVQSLERLQAFAMRAMDQMMLLLLPRTKKKMKTLLPFVTDFVTKLTNPMFESIDVVRYTQMSRLLKVAEEYGKRLLRTRYGPHADSIASRLVERFPEHSFPIYPDEARQIGLKLADLTPSLTRILENTTRYLPNLNAVGSVIEKGQSDDEGK
jgi:hypothetical protein